MGRVVDSPGVVGGQALSGPRVVETPYGVVQGGLSAPSFLIDFKSRGTLPTAYEDATTTPHSALLNDQGQWDYHNKVLAWNKPYNHLRYSNDFSQGDWQKTGTTPDTLTEQNDGWWTRTQGSADSVLQQVLDVGVDGWAGTAVAKFRKNYGTAAGWHRLVWMNNSDTAYRITFWFNTVTGVAGTKLNGTGGAINETHTTITDRGEYWQVSLSGSVTGAPANSYALLILTADADASTVRDATGVVDWIRDFQICPGEVDPDSIEYALTGATGALDGWTKSATNSTLSTVWDDDLGHPVYEFESLDAIGSHFVQPTSSGVGVLVTHTVALYKKNISGGSTYIGFARGGPISTPTDEPDWTLDTFTGVPVDVAAEAPQIGIGGTAKKMRFHTAVHSVGSVAFQGKPDTSEAKWYAPTLSDDGLQGFSINENLLLDTEDHSTGNWTLGAASALTAAQTESPFGTTTGDLFDMGSTGGDAFITQTVTLSGAGATFTYSRFVKSSGSADWVRLSADRPGKAISFYFNVTTGTDGSTRGAGGGTVAGAGSEDYGNGWYRIWITGLLTGESQVNCVIRTVDGDVGSNTDETVYIFGPNCTELAYLAPYIASSASTFTTSENLPSIALTNILDVRQNWLPNSIAEGPASASWPTGWTEGTDTSNIQDPISIDASTDRPGHFELTVEVDNDSGLARTPVFFPSLVNINAPLTAVQGDDVYVAVDIKLVSGTHSGVFELGISEYDAAGAFLAQSHVQFEDPTSDWRRFVGKLTMTDASAARVGFQIRHNGVADGATFRFAVRAPQFMKHHTSDYVETTGTLIKQVWHGEGATILLTDAMTRDTTTGGQSWRFIEIARAGTDDDIIMINSTNGDLAYVITTDGVVQIGTVDTGDNLTDNTAFNVAIRLKTDDVAVAYNGAITATDTSVDLPEALDRVYFLNKQGGGRAGRGWLGSVAVYSYALTDTELAKVTQ